MTFFTHQVPCISIGYLTETDFNRLVSPQRDPTALTCMYDPNDIQHGFFVWVDEVDPGQLSDPPEGYSKGFMALWHWAQGNGFTWIHLALGGDKVEGLRF